MVISPFPSAHFLTSHQRVKIVDTIEKCKKDIDENLKEIKQLSNKISLLSKKTTFLSSRITILEETTTTDYPLHRISDYPLYFHRQCLAALEENKDKQHWSTCNYKTIEDALLKQFGKYLSGDDRKRRLINIANYCMMLHSMDEENETLA